MGPTARQFVLAILLLATLAPVVSIADEADDQYAVAAGHYARKRWELAVEEFREYLQKHADHKRADDATFFMAESRVQLGRLTEAQTQFRDFLDRAPEHRYARQALFRAGETAYLSGQADAAIADLERFQRDYPDDQLNAYVWPYLGQIALEQDDPQRAEKYFRRALDVFPQGRLKDDCRLGLARSLEQLSKLEEAIALYREMAADRSSPLIDEVKFHLGAALYAEENYDEAIAVFGEFDAKLRDSKLRDKARLGHAWSLYRLDRFDEAREILESLATSATVGTQATYWLGLTQKALKRWDAAAETLLLVVEESADGEAATAVRYHAADALLRAGKVKAALEHFDRILEQEPQGPWSDDSLLRKLEAEFDRGAHEKISQLAADFKRQFPDSDLLPQVRRIEAKVLLAEGRNSDAIELLDGDRDEAPGGKDHAHELYLLALAYHGVHRYEEAFATLKTVLETASDQLAEDAHLLSGTALVGLKRFDEAIPPLRRYLASRPDGSGAARCRAELAICYARTSRIDQARRALDDLRDRHADDPLIAPTTLHLAEAGYAASEFDWAIELFGVLADKSESADMTARATSGLAWCHYRLGQYDEASHLFGVLIEEHKDHVLAPEAALARGRALENLDRLEAALAALRIALDSYPQSPQAPEALLAAARLYDRLEQDEQAAEHYQKLDSEYSDFKSRDTVLYEWAWVLRDLQRPVQANALFERLYRNHPESEFWSDAAYRLAERAAQTGDHDRTDEILIKLIQSDPEPVLLGHSLYLQGRTAAVQEKWAAAAGPLQQIISDYPDTELALLSEYWLGEAAYRQEKFSDAAERFGRLAEKTTDRRDPWVAMISLRRAQIFAHESRWTEALEIASSIPSAFEDFPQQYEADYVIGRSLAAGAQFEEAREAYRRVIRSPEGGKTKTAAMAQWMIGETYFHQKEFESALREYLRVEILYDYPTWQAAALLQAGKCHESLGQWQQATELYTRLLKQFPETSFTQEATRRLQVVEPTAARAGS